MVKTALYPIYIQFDKRKDTTDLSNIYYKSI